MFCSFFIVKSGEIIFCLNLLYISIFYCGFVVVVFVVGMLKFNICFRVKICFFCKEDVILNNSVVC